VDRAKCGTALHLATEEHGLPLAAVVTAANVNDGTQTQAVLQALVLTPPAPVVANAAPDERDLPHVRADGSYGNRPARQRAQRAGFRMLAPSQGQPRRKGLGRVRSAVERGHAALAQFGRVGRRLDRLTRRYLGWVELAACVIFLRAEAHGFFR
jgi:transposase